MQDIQDISFEIIDQIGIITLKNPPSNELRIPEFIPLMQFQQWTSGDSIKGIIITGSGKNFSTGGDLTEIFNSVTGKDKLEQKMAGGKALLNEIQSLEIPVIAAINRVCFGGGLEIALACHIRVAAENALLAFPEVNHNLMPGLSGTVSLPPLVGFAGSVMLLLGGDTVNASDAKKMGLVDFISPKDQAFDFAWDLMKKMTSDRPLTVIHSIMKAMKNAMSLIPAQAMEEETRLFCNLARAEALRRTSAEETHAD